jgi:valyl-tRNA synthetase
MDSSVSNLYTCGYLRDEKLFKIFPCSLRPQGREIIRTWLYYTLLKSFLLFGKKPFESVMINGMGLDEHGRAMHKSAGNYVPPRPIIEKHGADAYRFWAASEVNLGDDFRISEARVAGASKFLTKLWNVAKFVSAFEEKGKSKKKPKKLEKTDEWILAELNELIKQCNAGYAKYNFFVPSNKVREFVWNLFAPHYLEMAKARAYAGDESALYVLHLCLRTILELSAPIIPFITDKIYRDIYGETVHKKSLPKEKKEWESNLKALTPKLVEFNSQVWKEKKEKGLALNAEYKAEIPKELMLFADDLKKMHRLI